MAKKKGLMIFLFIAGLGAIVLKYVYLIIPAIITITFLMIIRRRNIRKEEEVRRVIYVRR